MADSDKNEIYLTSSPHFHSGNSVERLMYSVVTALIPLCIAGSVLFGWRALCMILVSVAVALLSEWIFNLIVKRKNTIGNGSAMITGIMLALVLPPTVPFWQLILGDVFAIIVMKSIFGGLGQNVWNPALGGRAFLFVSFPASIGASWLNPGTDVISSATVLSNIKSGVVDCESFILGSGHFSRIFEYKDLYRDFFFGYRAGCIGETSAILILTAGIILAVLKVIDWRIPLSYIGTVFLLSLIAGNDIVISVLGGGLLFGAFFMATDYVTSPMTKPGRLIFGCGCGIVTFLIRQFGGYPEGVMFSILFMNCFVPFLNNVTYRKYGYKKAKKAGDKK